MVAGRLARSESTGPSWRLRTRQAGKEGLDFSFRCEVFKLRVLEEQAVTAEPMGVGFFGVDGEVPEHTKLSHGTDCVVD